MYAFTEVAIMLFWSAMGYSSAYDIVHRKKEDLIRWERQFDWLCVAAATFYAMFYVVKAVRMLAETPITDEVLVSLTLNLLGGLVLGVTMYHVSNQSVRRVLSPLRKHWRVVTRLDNEIEARRVQRAERAPSQEAVASLGELVTGDIVSYRNGVANVLAVVAPGIYVVSQLRRDLGSQAEADNAMVASGVMTSYELAKMGFVRGIDGFDLEGWKLEQVERERAKRQVDESLAI